ncbi:MAG: type II toxin-antitoxin system HipA family toxin [Propionibacteriaceae bacterium]|jgi:serine/threonine-protein kinase HipA|nr:type II toxin-antitoxin system HipA family toxin [Propionibacteriaceae bacterium]
MRIHVSVEIDGRTRPAGTLYATARRGVVTSTFTYDTAYLESPEAYELDPELPLVAGTLPVTAPLPRAFSDAAPDRWGRYLINRRLTARARREERATRTLTDVDYLLEVGDATRQGALRFHTEPEGPFQHPSAPIPPLVELPELLAAARLAVTDTTGAEADEAIALLLKLGSASLGGARPKASVVDGDTLHIAKFPHPADEWNVIAWEAVALDLAEAAGITVPPHRLIWLDDAPILLAQRFDRQGTTRLGYMSAMTLCGATDGQPGDYLDIADRLAAISADPTADLIELWRRIAFSIAINNTDDHLRNHGVIRTKQGWRLSPVFDINPSPQIGAPRATAIGGETAPEAGMTALLETSELFGLDKGEASAALEEIDAGLSEWRRIASSHNLAMSEQTRFTEIIDRKK